MVVSSGQFYDQIEGNFVTLGGSTCSYTEVKDETKSTALIIECYCKKADQQSLKYICLYAGNLEKECPPFEENKDTFYKEIAKFFEGKLIKLSAPSVTNTCNLFITHV